MIISLVGNICTGKTTVGKLLSDAIGFKFISIDEERVKNKAHTYRRELASWNGLALLAKQHKDVIVESSGLSGRIHGIYKANGTRRFKVLLYAPIDVILERYEQREIHTPFYMYNANTKKKRIREMQVLVKKMSRNVEIDTSKHSVKETVAIIKDYVEGYRGIN